MLRFSMADKIDFGGHSWLGLRVEQTPYLFRSWKNLYVSKIGKTSGLEHSDLEWVVLRVVSTVLSLISLS
jgi:hypothetical protein